MPAPLSFRELASRLASHLKRRIEHGEISERSLARLTRYSQPHIHNVLKGKRGMNIELADQIMALLGISFDALMTGRAPQGEEESSPPAGLLPVLMLQGRLGGGKAYPRETGPLQRRFFPASALSGLVKPALARLDAGERSMWPALWPEDLVLLDRAPAERRRPDFERVYALCWKNRGLIGRCRRVGDALVVVADNTRHSRPAPSTLPLEQRDVLEVVRGRIVWLARDVDFAE